ncbi:hypothetical protein Vretimale_19560, partial [Volvox reticuliferus]
VAIHVPSQLTELICPLVTDARILTPVIPENCFDVSAALDCKHEPEPFPSCKCDKTKATTPYYTQMYISKEPGRKNGTTLYCFTVDLVPDWALHPMSACGSSERLEKAEIYADEVWRRNITGIRVRTNGGAPRWISPTWGTSGTNSMRVTPLRWDYTAAVGGEFCIELNIPLDSFCLGVRSCSVSLFNESKKCCSTYATALPYLPDFHFILPHS